MAVWLALRAWWRARQRKLDCEILWPSLVAGAEGDVRWAQNAMLQHAMTDAAWREEMDELEIYRAIAQLTERESVDNKSPWKAQAPSTGS
jgi:hypothetical protein